MLVPILLVSFLCLSGFALLFWVLTRRTRTGLCDVLEWVEGFSAADYRPMERLFDNRDCSFLASQSGFEPGITRRLRKERRKIFHSYLAGMIRDFHRLLAAARYITVYASQDQTAFASQLWRLRLSFYYAVVAVEFHVALEMLGIGGVEPRKLLAPVERLCSFTHSLIPAFE